MVTFLGKDITPLAVCCLLAAAILLYTQGNSWGVMAAFFSAFFMGGIILRRVPCTCYSRSGLRKQREDEPCGDKDCLRCNYEEIKRR